MSDTSNPNMKWYIVNTHSGFEAKARLGLIEIARQKNMENSLGEVIVPMEKVVEMKKGEKSERERKFFPGYMLVQMELSPQMWHVVNESPKIIGFVGGGKNPPPIPDREVERILSQMQDGLRAQKTEISFAVSDQVKVIDGPFKNFSGVVEEVNAEKGKVRVLVSIFGRATPLELDFEQVEPLEED